MQIVILAAGRGERLWPLTRNTPKCLLEVSRGMSVLDMQMQALSTVKAVTEVIFVLGYLAEQIEAKLMHYEKTHFEIRTIYNPFFADSNNLMSLWLALPYLAGDFIVVNGDDIYDASVPQGLVEYDAQKDIVMTGDCKDEYDLDDMKVVIEDGLVKQVSKKIPVEEANGESIGMIRFCGAGATYFKHAVNRLVRLPVGRSGFWLLAVQEMIDQGFSVNWYECPEDAWAEIDFHPDLKLVRDSLSNNYAELIRRWEQR